LDADTARSELFAAFRTKILNLHQLNMLQVYHKRQM